ncbi:FecR family protein [Pseudoxanthomonas suwonensis]|uniref:FecR family protein n=1 Tax=Pseudoxanthomonas suwonensis TaxID=314722 RepID=UPI00138EE7D7|nr:FecR domain-containing protein [Pseudoxanthomonas suwonensis]KAF1700765.1 iron dicitrate transport regulator FecR [Pseudoxanthomonas suwonensis]
MDGTRPARGWATQEAAQWHVLQREGAMSAAQQAQFMDWLVAAPEHLHEYLAVARVSGELAEAMRGMRIDLDAAGGEDAAAEPANVVPLPVARGATARPPARPRLRRFAAAAAAVLALGVLPLLWPQPVQYRTAAGAPRSFALADGTRVHMNGDSELRARLWLLQRRVELARGQASFEVAPDRRPFAVHAAGLVVRDIGTTFDVALERDQARIAVSEGRVHVAAGARLLADLRAGDGARVAYDGRTVRLERGEADAMTAGRRGRVVFRDVPQREVAERFNRLNPLRLHVEDEAAGPLRPPGNLAAGDLASLRAFLDEQPTLSTRVADGGIHVASRRRARAPQR